MTIKHVLVALIVALVWGLNFVAMKMAFLDLPPFLFLFLRLLVTVAPLILFFPRPKIPFLLLFWVSLFQWVIHFALLFSGLYLGLSGGIASLIMQSQIIFTLFLTFVYFGNKPSGLQITGLLVSFAGLILLTTHGECSANVMGILLIVGAAFAVGVSNILFRSMPKDTNMAAMIVWSSALALPQALILSLLIEGWEVAYTSLSNLTLQTCCAMSYTVFVSTMIGIVGWARLMQQSDPVKVLPFALLVPVVALTAGHLIMDEVVTLLDVVASIIIISGFLVNQLSALKRARVLSMPVKQEEELKKAA